MLHGLLIPGVVEGNLQHVADLVTWPWRAADACAKKQDAHSRALHTDIVEARRAVDAQLKRVSEALQTHDARERLLTISGLEDAKMMIDVADKQVGPVMDGKPVCVKSQVPFMVNVMSRSAEVDTFIGEDEEFTICAPSSSIMSVCFGGYTEEDMAFEIWVDFDRSVPHVFMITQEIVAANLITVE